MAERETQATVAAWIEETFPGGDPNSPRRALRALEECVELCRAAGASFREIESTVHEAVEAEIARIPGGPGMPSNRFARPTPKPEKVAAEAADVLIVLYGLAGLRGFDLHAEVDRKMAVNRHEREWIANGDGTGYHKKKGVE